MGVACEQGDGLVDVVPDGLLDVGGAVGLTGGVFFEVVDDVGVGDRHQVFGDGGERNPGEFFEFFVLLGGEFSFESGEAGGEGGGFVSGDRQRRGPFHQLCEGEGFVAVEWCGGRRMGVR